MIYRHKLNFVVNIAGAPLQVQNLQSCPVQSLHIYGENDGINRIESAMSRNISYFTNPSTLVHPYEHAVPSMSPQLE